MSNGKSPGYANAPISEIDEKIALNERRKAAATDEYERNLYGMLVREYKAWREVVVGAKAKAA